MIPILRARETPHERCLRMTCCDPLEAECPLDLTEDACRTLIRLLRHAITPDREPVLPWSESLSDSREARICRRRLIEATVVIELLDPLALGPVYARLSTSHMAHSRSALR